MKETMWIARRWGLLIVFVALTVRLTDFWLLFPKGGWREVGYGSELGQIAANLAAGRGFSSPFENGAQPSAWLSPMVPFIWAGVFRYLGEYSMGALIILGVLQCIVSALACVVYYLIAAHLWRRAGGAGNRWPLVVSATFILWPMCLRAATVFWYFSWQELAMAVLFLAALQWLEKGTMKRGLTMGGCAGVMALINPVPLVVLPGAFIMAWREGAAVRRHTCIQFAAACWVAGVMIAPWLVRNSLQLHAFVPIRSSFGVELLQGNNPEGAIMQARHSLHPALNPVERARFNELGEIGYGRWAMQTAVRYVRTSVGMTARRTALRIYAFWCSDIRGDWAWDARPPWWHEGPVAILRALIKTGVWVLPVVLLIVAAVRGALAQLPAKGLFVVLLVGFPLPYYLTHVSPMYAYVVQPYMLIAALVGLGLSKRDRLGTAH